MLTAIVSRLAGKICHINFFCRISLSSIPCRPEPVADSADGLDRLAGLAEFLAKTENLYVNGSRRDQKIIAADGIDDLLPGKDPARLGSQQREDAEFGHRQVQLFAAQADLVPPLVDLQA